MRPVVISSLSLLVTFAHAAASPKNHVRDVSVSASTYDAATVTASSYNYPSSASTSPYDTATASGPSYNYPDSASIYYSGYANAYDETVTVELKNSMSGASAKADVNIDGVTVSVNQLFAHSDVDVDGQLLVDTIELVGSNANSTTCGSALMGITLTVGGSADALIVDLGGPVNVAQATIACFITSVVFP